MARGSLRLVERSVGKRNCLCLPVSNSVFYVVRAMLIYEAQDEMMTSAIRAPFRMDKLLKMADSQLGGITSIFLGETC